MDTLLEILNPHFLLRNALYGGLIIGIVAPLVGVYLLARRMVFLGVALPQISTAGVAAAFVWHTYFHGHQSRDVSDFMLALVGSEIVVLGLLKGEIIAIPDIELLILFLGYGAILILLTVFHKELVLVTVDREMAISLGKRVLVWDLVLFGIIGVAISLGVLVVGPLVMFGFLIVPPMIAGRSAIGMRNVSIVAALVGAGIALAGFAAAYRLDLPTGPTDVALAGVVLAVVMAWQSMRAFVFRTTVQ